MRQWMEQHEVLTVAIAAIAIAILWYLRLVWAVGLIGFIIAASLLPVIDFLQKRRMPRALAILITYLAALAILALVCIPIVLSFIGEAQGLTSDLTATLNRFLGPNSFFDQIGVSAETAVSYIQSAIVPITTSTMSVLAGVLSALVISIYTLYDWRDREETLAHGSAASIRIMGNILKDSERDLGAWARGELMLIVSIGILTFIALLILGIPYAGPLAGLTGLFELIPYAGPIISAIPAILIGLSISPTEGLIVTGVYIAIHQLENQLFVPLIMKNAVRIHPVIVILALLAGYEIMGILGAVIAVPLMIIVRILSVRLRLI